MIRLAPTFVAAVLLGSITATPQAHPPSARISAGFTDVTREAGIDFRHVNGASSDKYLVETMGSGGLFFDYDDDGAIDVFLVDGGSFADPAVARRARHRLFRNRGNGTFQDVTAQSGIQHRDYGMGACAGDYDNDGRVDLYVTNVGPNTLYRNGGGGRFTDVTRAAGVGSPLWSASCAFADLDKDGDLDLFVTNYVDIRLTASGGPYKNPFCGDASLKARGYCHPLTFDPLPNVVYRNDGNGRFTDVSAESGVAALRSNGLGVVVSDFDDDGWQEVFVANDSMPNFLFRRTAQSGSGQRSGQASLEWRFEESALRAGVAVASDGKPRAGMGTDAGDYDGDGHLDLVVTNLDFQMHSLYRSLGRLFAYATPESGIGPATMPFVGFGVVFFDFDHDTQLDVAFANGHLMDNPVLRRAGSTYGQRNLLLRNVGARRYADITASAGTGFELEKVSRGLAAGDIDNDGDLDLLVTNNGQTADLLRNDAAQGNALLLRLIGRQSNRDGIGARIRVTSGARTQLREVKAGSSYLGQNDLRQHVGLGTSVKADRVEVKWPGGKIDVVHDLPANLIVTIREGDGVIGRQPFARR